MQGGGSLIQKFVICREDVGLRPQAQQLSLGC